MSSISLVSSLPFETHSRSKAATSSAQNKTTDFAALLSEKTQSTQTTQQTQASSSLFDTNQGTQPLEIEAYFSPTSAINQSLSELPPLLMPSASNIAALTAHLSSAFPEFLRENNIPSAPSSITFDNYGNIQLPEDYPYAEQLKTALESNPSMDREVRTLHALTSHYVEMQKSIPFQQEYAAAKSQAEIDSVIAKYHYLFSNHRTYSEIALNFSENGSLNLISDGRPLSIEA